MKKFLTRSLLGLVLLGSVAGATGCGTTPPAGETGVVRNGGPFDNKNIRGGDKPADGVVVNGAGYSWVGLFSTVHYYPVASQQRFYKADSCFGQTEECSADRGPFRIQTKDGVDLGIEATAYLNTTFDGSDTGNQNLKAFDTQFATRTFNGKHVYDGPGGFSKFLAAIVDPIASNNLRDVGSGLECAQFVSSCALVQNQDPSKIKTEDLVNKNNQSTLKDVQDAVAAGLRGDLIATIGGKNKNVYFDNIKVVITKVDLPGEVQDAIAKTQASFANVSKVNAEVAQATARVKVAHQEYLRNQEKQKGYNACASCARQDELKSLPSGLQTYAPGSSYAVGR